ncbi:DUF3455 domain-containing protein [Methylacidimicrobium tartarophylax]|uniref:DUF3455 domain-containing protein n=1 Tax=Methylacidimicrobium tartarophylax TaxID=1041768 RepID=A0A5E6MCS3_9BACT|nr:DUF3455 domain-containing protein [Methylacidimicrobium tartarophylax]VVM07048.1 hypothetical protein MAMT_01525 [Methylacidimicrobium tartarophylax]
MGISLCRRQCRLLAGCLFSFLFALPLLAETPSREPSLDLPSDSRLVWTAHASGFQVYKAQASVQSQASFKWVFLEPDATLQDSAGATVGRHFRGPCWEAEDGSRIVGLLPPLAQCPGRGPTDVPWLLIAVHSTGSPGVLSGVTHVLRVATAGGAAPARPPASAGETVRVPYRATYLFLGPATKPNP